MLKKKNEEIFDHRLSSKDSFSLSLVINVDISVLRIPSLEKDRSTCANG